MVHISSKATLEWPSSFWLQSVAGVARVLAMSLISIDGLYDPIPPGTEQLALLCTIAQHKEKIMSAQKQQPRRSSPRIGLYTLDDWIYVVDHETQEVLYGGHSVDPDHLLSLVGVPATKRYLPDFFDVDNLEGHETYEELMEVMR